MRASFLIGRCGLDNVSDTLVNLGDGTFFMLLCLLDFDFLYVGLTAGCGAGVHSDGGADGNAA